MKLKELLNGVEYRALRGTDDIQVENIAWDSRKVVPGSLFICVKGKKVDRHDFALPAVKAGAVVLVVEHEIGEIPQDVTIISVENTQMAMARIACNFYGDPSDGINLIGITGTNGKTSVSWFIGKIMEQAGRKSGIIGTIENRIGNRKSTVAKLNPTTPDSIELQASLREMRNDGVTDVAMEVTSIALVRHRVDGCHFSVGVFTNLTRDHLDEHGTMENYKRAKMRLFNMCRYGMVNADDPICPEIREASRCEKLFTYGIDNEADYRAEQIQYSPDGVRFILRFKGERLPMMVRIPGRFTVYNALAAIGACHLSGLSLEQIRDGLLQVEGVDGRFESVPNPKGCYVIVDYAHTPDGLENVLRSAREFACGRILAVFGCGGDRDKTKRPIMGEIAGRLADLCIVTSDNPRSEEPGRILKDIEAGLRKTECPYIKLVDRKEAIHIALRTAQPGDVVLVAGKGHETYQIFADRTIHFSDKEVIREYFRKTTSRKNAKMCPAV